MHSAAARVVVIGTGGTIAGVAPDSASHVGYRAGALSVQDLVAALPTLKGQALETLSLAQVDSSDMDHATWHRLAEAVAEQLQRPEVAGVVVTHGTDTLEETAFFLHRCVGAHKPVVLTAAMRPASAPSPDGPQNLLDALLVARVGLGTVAGDVRTNTGRVPCQGTAAGPGAAADRGADAPPSISTSAGSVPSTTPDAGDTQDTGDTRETGAWATARGVVVVLAGRVYAGVDLRKLHGYRVDAFDSGDAGPLGLVEDGRLRCFRPWPDEPLHPAAAMLGDPARWPVVEIVTSHAGARGATIDALVAAGADGIVIAGTGNGSVHHTLLQAARRAQAAGVSVRRSSRCILGGVVGSSDLLAGLPSAGALTPAQARIELMLDIVAGNG